MKKKRSASFDVIIPAVFATAFVLGVFRLLVNPSDIRDLEPNAIGDTIAGISSSIAFIWLIASIFIQSRELQAQREEIADLADNSEIQARALLQSAKSQGTILLRETWESIEPSTQSHYSQLSEYCREFIRVYSNLVHDEDFARRPDAALPHIVEAIFCTEDYRISSSKVFDSNIMLEAIETIDLRDHINHEAFILAENILLEQVDIWKLIKPSCEIAENLEMQEYQASWEVSVDIHWIRLQYPLYRAINARLRAEIVSGRIEAPPNAVLWFAIFEEGHEELFPKDAWS